MELSNRQVEILKEKGLPTSYDELSDLQRNNINAIEEMFVYLEKKYNEEFEFVEYIPKSDLETEMLTVKVKDGTSLDLVNVERLDGKLIDNYSNILVLDKYESVLSDFFDEYTDDFKVYSEVNNVSGNINDDNLLGIVNSSNCVFIKSTNISQERFNEIVDEYAKWYKNQIVNESNCTTIYLCEANYYNDLTRFNYKSKLVEEYVDIYKTISISNDGSVSIY